MKIVYKANSGRVFEHLEDAEKEDRFVAEVDVLLKPFRDKNLGPGEFVQRNSEMVQDLIDKTYRLLVRYYGATSDISKRWQENPRGFVGRLLDDADSPALPIVGVIWSIDNRNRQWQQPYFALEANKGNYPK